MPAVEPLPLPVCGAFFFASLGRPAHPSSLALPGVKVVGRGTGRA